MGSSSSDSFSSENDDRNNNSDRDEALHGLRKSRERGLKLEETDKRRGKDRVSDEEGIPNGDNHDDDQKEEAIRKPKKIHKLSLTKTTDFNEKLKKRGVIYIARIPPRLTPTKLKTIMSDFGEVTRVYLVEEDAAARKRRRKLSGNGSKRYLEGWIEFASKKRAKNVAASLNNTPMSNQKRNPHYGDLWCLKYLHKFTWSHLTEKVAYERRVREQKLRLETMQARRETAAYKQLVETGKKLDKIEERKRRRAEKEGKVANIEDEKIVKKPKKERKMKVAKDDADKATKKALLGALV
jgi:ESF2/ABP1 family protein